MAEAKSLRSVRNSQCLGAWRFGAWVQQPQVQSCGNMGMAWVNTGYPPWVDDLTTQRSFDQEPHVDDSQQHGIVLLFAVSISSQQVVIYHSTKERVSGWYRRPHEDSIHG